jgi:hypothetical protein
MKTVDKIIVVELVITVLALTQVKAVEAILFLFVTLIVLVISIVIPDPLAKQLVVGAVTFALGIAMVAAMMSFILCFLPVIAAAIFGLYMIVQALRGIDLNKVVENRKW